MPRFLSMIRIDERNAPASGPSPELQQRMGVLMQEMTKEGVMVETAGLKPTSEGTRVTWSGGQVSRIDGPFAESKEVVGGYAILRCADMAEALVWTERFLRTHEEHWTVNVEVREIIEM